MTQQTSSTTSEPFGYFSLTPLQMRLLRLAQRQAPGWLGRRIALILRKLVLWRRTHPIDAPVGAFKLRAHVSDNVSERKFLFMPNFCDPAERKYVTEHLSPDGVFLDIGANAGIYTLTAAREYERLRSRGRVLAVEANPVMQARLRFNIQLNALEGHARTIPVALSDHVGEVAFTVSDTNLGESGLDTRGSKKIIVPCTTLLDLIRDEGVSQIDGIKIDVEGVEDVILTPFLEHADRALLPGFIIIENSSGRWRSDLLGLLRQVGYVELGRHKMNHIMVLEPPSPG